MTQTLDPFDELAAMFLTDEDDDEPGTRSAAIDAPRASRAGDEPGAAPGAASAGRRARAEVELLVVGHLPVRAGLWLTPYADAVARTRGPVGLVRLDGDEPTVEVLRAEELLPGHWQPPDLGTCRTLRDAIRQVGASVRTWIVRPAPEAEPRDMLHAARVARVGGAGPALAADRVTVLSSGNQAAVVHAYRILKSLHEACRAAAIPMPPVGLAVVGTDAAGADRIAQPLDETSRSWLEAPVPLVQSLPRIDAGIRSSFRRRFPGHADVALADVMAWIEDARDLAPDDVGVAEIVTETPPRRSSPAPAPPFTAAPPPFTASPPATRAPALPVTPAPAEIVVPARPAVPPAFARPVARSDAAVSSRPRTASSTPAPRFVVTRGPERLLDPVAPPEEPPIVPAPPSPGPTTAARGAAAVEVKETGQVREPDDGGRPVALARFAVQNAGPEAGPLVPITPRCPGHERVELAVDRRGVVHLLGHEDTMRSLPVVASWVRAHRELLAMACPHCTIDPAGRTVPHVFCGQPIDVSDLHGCEMHLHLLAPVEVDGRRGWYAAALNRPAAR